MVASLMSLAREDQDTVEFDEPPEYNRFMDISRAVDMWLGSLERKGRSPRTIASYRRILDRLTDMLPGVDIGEVTPAQVMRFIDSLALNARTMTRPGRGWQAGKPKAPGTRAIEVTVVNNMFDWLRGKGLIQKNPTRQNEERILSRPSVGRPEDNQNVTSISSVDARTLIAAAEDWDDKLIIGTLAYLGPRRRALALTKLADYQPPTRQIIEADGQSREIIVPAYLTFRNEKGSKSIQKPVPLPLAETIQGAIAAGVYDEQDWLIPNRTPGHSAPVWKQSIGATSRDDRFIYRRVKLLGSAAGVNTHVHALRAAFAVFFLESGGDKYDLQLLMGHVDPATTEIYLRRLDKRKRMESVLSLDWGEAPSIFANYAENIGSLARSGGERI